MSSPRFPFLTAVYLIAIKDGQVLLSRRYQTGWMDGTYTLPAGHVDGGETIYAAMSREAKEEVGLDIAPHNQKLIHVIHRNTGDREYFDFFLETNQWEGAVTNNEPEKCDDIGWFDINALPANTLDYVALVLKHRNTEMRFSSIGFD